VPAFSPRIDRRPDTLWPTATDQPPASNALTETQPGGRLPRFRELQQQMRALEYFHGLPLLPHTWPIVRVDGRSFSRMTAQRFDKPFDERFHTLMVVTASTLLEELQGVYAYTESAVRAGCNRR
jgi:hypothetical protein